MSLFQNSIDLATSIPNISSITILGDFNDRCIEWDSDHTTSELGNRLKNLIQNSLFFQLINNPTRDHHLLDLLLTDSPNYFLNTGVIPSISNLDHDIIFGEFKILKPIKSNITRNIRYYNRGDYDKLNEILLNTPWDNIDNQSPIDADVKILTDTLIKAMDECIPSKTVTIRPKDKPGFTSKVRKLYRECQHLHKIKLRTKNPLDIDRYRAKRKEAKDAFRQAKSEHFENLSTRLMDPETSSKSYWKLVRGVYGNKQSVGIPPLVEDGELITDDSTKATLLNNYFVSQTIPPTSNTPLPPFTYRTDKRISTIDITPSNVQDILTDLNISKACGPDGINNKVLKECSYSLSFPLAIIFQKSIDLGYFPDSWKEAMVAAILKKNDRQDKTNYRPISLLTCMSKVFKRIVFNQLP